MVDPGQITGLILAGGQSSRMQQGQLQPVDKGLLLLHGHPLVAWVQQYLAGRVGTVWVSANRSIDAFSPYGEVMTDDPIYGESAGPLAGVASALERLRTPWLLTLPVDTPILPDELLPQLLCAAQDGGKLVSAVTDQGSYPLCMLVHRDMAASLHAYLFSGQRKVKAWQALAGGTEVHFSAQGEAFFNINTPADLQQLQARLATLRSGQPIGKVVIRHDIVVGHSGVDGDARQTRCPG